MDPEAVAGQEVGDGGDGQRLAGAGDADVDARTDEVKAGVGVSEPAGEAEEQRGQKQASGAVSHASSLDGMKARGR
jgi:hypothetical protein